jgi:ADP-ribose pyrophosphatase
MFVFLATELTEVGQKLEDDELLTIERRSLPDLLEMVRRGEIEDAKTISSLFLYHDRLAANSAAG